MELRPLGRTGLKVAPLVFGGNVFGWTADEKTSHTLLDAFVDAGFNAVDTADKYSAWVPGNKGGESETIIGSWLAANPSKRGKVLILTKVGSVMGGAGDAKSLKPDYIAKAVEDSLRRLKTDVIDLYQSHWPDPDTSYEDTLRAYEMLLKAGKVRAIGCSNLNAAQLGEALKVAREKNLPRYETLQPEYNLYNRAAYDGPLRDLAMREGLGVITYYSLASGFLTGKYRTAADTEGRTRGEDVARYLDDRGLRILAALDRVAAETGATPAEISLAWLMAKPTVTAPIASATSLSQLESLMKAASLSLSPAQVAALDTAGASA